MFPVKTRRGFRSDDRWRTGIGRRTHLAVLSLDGCSLLPEGPSGWGIQEHGGYFYTRSTFVKRFAFTGYSLVPLSRKWQKRSRNYDIKQRTHRETVGFLQTEGGVMLESQCCAGISEGSEWKPSQSDAVPDVSAGAVCSLTNTGGLMEKYIPPGSAGTQ